jgi:hypothetical protein
MARALEAEQPVSVELINYKRNGEEFRVALDIAPVHNAEGLTTHYVATQRGVSPCVAAEAS